jgi:hypothetical protein
MRGPGIGLMMQAMMDMDRPDRNGGFGGNYRGSSVQKR